MLISFGLTSNQAFAGVSSSGQAGIDCEKAGGIFDFFGDPQCTFPTAVGGELLPIDSTMVLVAGSQNTAAWMIPVIVSGIGITIVIARKF